MCKVHLIQAILSIVFCRLREKEKLFAVFRDIERQMKDSNFELDRDLYPDNIERSWSQLMMLFQVIITISLISVKRRGSPAKYSAGLVPPNSLGVKNGECPLGVCAQKGSLP